MEFPFNAVSGSAPDSSFVSVLNRFSSDPIPEQESAQVSVPDPAPDAISVPVSDPAPYFFLSGSDFTSFELRTFLCVHLRVCLSL